MYDFYFLLISSSEYYVIRDAYVYIYQGWF